MRINWTYNERLALERWKELRAVHTKEESLQLIQLEWTDPPLHNDFLEFLLTSGDPDL